MVDSFYLVGSIALGAYRPARSDIDFVALIASDLDRDQLRRLRAAQVRSGLRTTTTALKERRSPLTGTLNGVFIRRSDVCKPVTKIVPVASQVGERFFVGHAGSEVSPVASSPRRPPASTPTPGSPTDGARSSATHSPFGAESPIGSQFPCGSGR